MKKVLMVLGGVFVVLVVLGIAGFAILASKGRALDRESKEYVDVAIPAIVSHWDIGEIQKRSSPEFKAVTKDADLEKLIQMYRRLGKFKAYNGAKGEAHMSATAREGKTITAVYVGNADFETGPAEVKMSLIKHGNQWQIYGIHINSIVFLNQP